MVKKSLLIIGAGFIVGVMVLVGCAKKEEPVTTTTGGGTTTTTGTVTGTATYTTEFYSAASATKPIRVGLFPLSGTSLIGAVGGTWTASGASLQVASLSSSGSTYTFSDVPAGDYVVVAYVDGNNDGKWGSYEPMNTSVDGSAPPASNVFTSGSGFTSFAVAAGVTVTKSLGIFDQLTPYITTGTGHIAGTIMYTGTAGTPSASVRLYAVAYPSSNTAMTGAPNGTTIQQWGYGNGSIGFMFVVPAGDYRVLVFVDLNGDKVLSTNEPYLIYTPGNTAGTGTFGTAGAVFTVVNQDVSNGSTLDKITNVTFGDTFRK